MLIMVFMIFESWLVMVLVIVIIVIVVIIVGSMMVILRV